MCLKIIKFFINFQILHKYIFVNDFYVSKLKYLGGYKIYELPLQMTFDV